MFLEKGKQIMMFLFGEIIAKSLLICFVTTFLVSLLLTLTPIEKGIKVLIREDVSDMNKTSQLSKESCAVCHIMREVKEATETASISKEEKPDKNFLMFYIDWAKGVIQGEPGRGKSGQNMAEEIKQKFPVTLIISFASVIPALCVSFLIGLFQNKPYVRAAGNTIYLFTALPAFFLGYFLIGLFGYYPSAFINYLLAIFTLGLSSGIINEMGRFIDNAMSNELSRDYIETAKVKGLRESTFPRLGTTGFHAFRNALISIVPKIGSLFAFIISGSMIVEQVFGLQGLSFMLLDGFTEKDRARVLTVILLSVVLVRMGAIITNFLYLLLNPRYGQR